MKVRRAFSIFTLITSSILLAAVVIAWGVSLMRTDEIWRTNRRSCVVACSHDGRLLISVWRSNDLLWDVGLHWVAMPVDGSSNVMPRWNWRWLGLDGNRGGAANLSAWGQWYIFPYWPVVVLTSILPGLKIRRTIRKLQRRGRGQCETCGYDLRASGNRCAECGAAIPISTLLARAASQPKAGVSTAPPFSR